MLRQLFIRNLAIIEMLELEFAPGMTVLTGETGAGKSILVDAFGLILGDRASVDLIRDGAKQAEVVALIDLANLPMVSTKLAELDIEQQGQAVNLRRILHIDGRSRAYINNTPITIKALREVGEILVDIHGQHAHQSLLRRDIQRQILDSFANQGDLLQSLQEAYQYWRMTVLELKKLAQQDGDQAAQQDLLRYQIEEMRTITSDEHGYEDWVKEHKRLSNAGQLLETVQWILNEISEENGVASRLVALQQALSRLSEYDQSTQSLSPLLEGAAIQLDEICDELRPYQAQIELDPGRLQEVERRLEQYHTLARKYKIPAKEVCSYAHTLSERLSQLENKAILIEDMYKKREQALADYRSLAEQLHQVRHTAANQLARQITDNLHTLGMPNAIFYIELSYHEDGEPSPMGLDDIEFQIVTNTGSAPKPLSRIASGGELSRISLAIQILISGDKGVPIMIFDEVDAGIGGGVAEVVGRLLFQLGQYRQVFCVTHLAQVASFAQHHYRVSKISADQQTSVRVNRLTPSDRIEEVARMLGGMAITQESRAHAKKMLTLPDKA